MKSGALETGVFEDKVNREIYLVQRDLWSELAGEVFPVCLFLAVNRQGDVFMWAAKLPGAMAAVQFVERFRTSRGAVG